MPSKSRVFELELFLTNVREELLDPNNIRKPIDNLSKDERLAMRSLVNSDLVIRIQDKDSRFVVLDFREYESKIMTQLNNPLHYQCITDNPVLGYFEVIKSWAAKWVEQMQITKQIAD